jgi:uncharacterized RmlC-like cupin family protein
MDLTTNCTIPCRQLPTLWAGTVVVKPNVKPRAHSRRTRNCLYIVKVRARFRLGDHLEFVAEAGLGISSTSRRSYRTKSKRPDR